MHFCDSLLFSNSITLLCQKCSKFGNFQNGKNGMFFFAPTNFTRSTGKKKIKQRVTDDRDNLFCKKHPIRTFLYKKNEPKSGPRQRLFASPRSASKRPENVCRGFFFFFKRLPKIAKLSQKYFKTSNELRWDSAGHHQEYI